jgi:hypothetical protein
MNGSCAECFIHSLCTAAFHEDIKPTVPQIVEMLKSSNSGIQSSGENVLAKLAEQCML